MKKRPAFSLVNALLLTSLALCASFFTAEAQTTAKIPSFVLKDAGDEVVGKVIGFQAGGMVSIAMDDPGSETDAPIHVTMPTGTFRLEGAFGRVFYTLAGCDGAAYLTRPSTVTRPMTKWLRKIYEVGVEPGGTDLIVFRGSDTLAAPQPAMIQSAWQSGSCMGSAGTGPYVNAVEIINITSQFGDPSTWTLE